MTDQLSSGANLVHIRALTGGAGGEGQHGHTRLHPELAGSFSRGNGNVSQLLSGGLRVDGAVTVNQYAVFKQHQEHRGNNGSARLGLDDLEGRHDGVGGGVYRT